MSGRRERGTVDYAALHNAGDTIFGGDASRFHALLEKRLPTLCAAEGRYTAVASMTVTAAWLRVHGLSRPLLISGRAGLGLRVPIPSFSVTDVATVVGRDFPVAVMDVAAQTELTGWTLGSWADYFATPPAARKRVLNVISLEFSGTPLSRLVRSPSVVRSLDWADIAWPGGRRAGGEYPLVQYYCLMSVAGSWTDFHVDFGGTSVWYHVHTGSKVFILIPPSPPALAAYEAWATSKGQAATFLPDTLPGGPAGPAGAFTLTIPAGGSLLIPSGYIHAVYTPADSLVFGGNFLHGLSMPSQAAVAALERATRVARKYRMPYYEHCAWYAAAMYAQYTRLPGFRAALEAVRAVPLVAAHWLATSGVGGEEGEELGKHAAAVLAAEQAASALGLSASELSGLPSLLQMLQAFTEEARVREAAKVAAASEGAGEGEGASAAPSVRLRLKLAPAKETSLRVKGSFPGGRGSAAPGPDASYGADERTAFPVAAAAREAAAMAGIAAGEGAADALLAELGLALGAEAAPLSGLPSLLLQHVSDASRHAVPRPLYAGVGAWKRGQGGAAYQAHGPILSSPQEAAAAAAAVGGTCCLGLFSGGIPTFEGEEEGEDVGADVVLAREAAAGAGAASAPPAGAGRGAKSKRQDGRGSGKPSKRGKYDGEDSEGEDAGDEDYGEGGGESSSSSSGSSSEEEESESDEDALAGEAELKGDGEAVIAVAGVSAEIAAEKALLAELEAKKARRAENRRANAEAAALFGNIKVKLSAPKASLSIPGEGGSARILVGAAGLGQARRLVPAGAPGVRLGLAPPPNAAVRAVGYTRVEEGEEEEEAAGAAAAAAVATEAAAAEPTAPIVFAGAKALASSHLSGAQRLAAALKAKGRR